MSRSVPERWLEYKPYGDVIKGTKILAFKVPLKEAIAKNLLLEQRFTTSILLQAFPRLKCIVDLTNTDRYYDRKEFTDAGIRYEKIMVPGKRLPPLDMVKKFFKVMDDFMSSCGEDDLIGVHCTHGINRTGYFICRYLIQQLDWENENSLKAFEEARGYPIEHDSYLSALRKVPRGEKISTKDIRLSPPLEAVVRDVLPRKNLLALPLGMKHPIGRPAVFPPQRRGFANDILFPPQSFFGGFRPGPIPPPPPGMSPMPPPRAPMYGPRPMRFGPPMRPPLPPGPSPGPGFPGSSGFPPRLPGPPRMPGPPRLPPGPPARLPPPKMPPPPPPPSGARPAVITKRYQTQKKKQHPPLRNGMVVPAPRNPFGLNRRDVAPSRALSKAFKEQDFTVDTFEENLLAATSTAQHRRPIRGRFHQAK